MEEYAYDRAKMLDIEMWIVSILKYYGLTVDTQII